MQPQKYQKPQNPLSERVVGLFSLKHCQRQDFITNTDNNQFYFTFFFAHFATLLDEESVKSFPFTTFAPFAAALIPFMLPEIPLPPLVQNGTIFFPGV